MTIAFVSSDTQKILPFSEHALENIDSGQRKKKKTEIKISTKAGILLNSYNTCTYVCLKLTGDFSYDTHSVHQYYMKNIVLQNMTIAPNPIPHSPFYKKWPIDTQRLEKNVKIELSIL